MASFDENGKYIKTNWKAGDKITATKLNKIEESIEAVNDNDISRHVEADARLDALEAKDVAHDKELTNIKNTIADNKAAAELGDYEINSRMTFLENELNEGIEEVHNVASTVDGKIATAETNMTNAVNQGKADMEAMVAEVEADLEGLHDELNEQLADIAINVNKYKNLVTNNYWSDAINKAIDDSYNKGKKIYIPSGIYKLDKPINLKEGCYLLGETISNNWSLKNTGTILEYYGTGSCIIVGNELDTTSNVKIENIYLYGKSSDSVGLKIGMNDGTTENYLTHTSDIIVNNVVIRDFTKGIQINRAFGLNLTNVKTMNCNTGWEFTDQDTYSMTYSNFMCCGSYSSDVAFLFNRYLSHSTSFKNCFIDDTRIGVKILKNQNKCKFYGLGIENIKEYGIYIEGNLIQANFECCSISPNNEDTSNIKDYIYYNSNEMITLKDCFISSYSVINTGYYHVNIKNGKAIIDNSAFATVNGEYYGYWSGHGSLDFSYKPQGIKLSALDITATSTYYIDVRGLREFVTVKTTGRNSEGNIPAVVLNYATKGQVLTLLGVDDENKFLLDGYYYPKIGNRYFLGKGDFVKLIYEDLDGSGLNWWLIDKSVNREATTPPSSGMWEQGTIIFNSRPQSTGAYAWICTQRGTPGVWTPLSFT